MLFWTGVGCVGYIINNTASYMTIKSLNTLVTSTWHTVDLFVELFTLILCSHSVFHIPCLCSNHQQQVYRIRSITIDDLHELPRFATCHMCLPGVDIDVALITAVD